MFFRKQIEIISAQRSFLSNVLVLMTGTTTAQAITILLSPLLTRLYSPVEYGTMALFTSILGVFSVIATLRYELTIMLPEKNEDAINIVVLSTFFSILLSFLLLIVVFIFNNVFVKHLQNAELSNWLYFIPLMVFLIGLFQSMHYWCSRRKEYKKISIAHITRSGLKGSFQIGAIYVMPGISTAGLIGGAIAGQLVSTIIIVVQSSKGILKEIKSVNIKKLINLAARYKKFPLLNTPHSLVNTLSSNLPVMLLTFFFSSRVAGLYSLSMMAVLLPIGLISNAIGQVFYQRISEAYNNQENLYIYTYKLLKGLVLASVIPFLLLFFIAPILFGFVFGKEWIEAGQYTRIILPWVFFVFLVAPLSYLPITLGYQKKAFLIEVVGIIMKIFALFIGSYFNDPILALCLFSVSGVLILVYSITWMVGLSKKELVKI